MFSRQASPYRNRNLSYERRQANGAAYAGFFTGVFLVAAFGLIMSGQYGYGGAVVVVTGLSAWVTGSFVGETIYRFEKAEEEIDGLRTQLETMAEAHDLCMARVAARQSASAVAWADAWTDADVKMSREGKPTAAEASGDLLASAADVRSGVVYEMSQYRKY